jgi:catechol 2,3-dioxygenase
MSLPAAARIAYARLQVSDLARSLTFYRDLMGLQVLEITADRAALSANGAAPALLELNAVADAQPKPRRSTGLYHVAIRLPNRAALAKLFYRLAWHEVPFDGFSDHKVSEALYLPDPDGNGLELYRDRPRSEWHYDGTQVAMGTEPLDYQKLLREGEHPIESWTGIDPATDIGHVHLHVGDLGRAEVFYADVLGMDVMVRGYPGALFVAAGGYHHHIGLNTWAGVNAPPPPANAVGLRAFGIHIPQHNDWDAVVARLRAAGVAVEERADNDWHIASAYDGEGSMVEVVTAASRQ